MILVILNCSFIIINIINFINFINIIYLFIITDENICIEFFYYDNNLCIIIIKNNIKNKYFL